MPICTVDQTILFFAHIPKTGGSSIEAYLRCKGPLTLFGVPKVDGIHQQHLTRDQMAALPDLPRFDHSFAVLRDPVSRMVSEFLWRSRPLKPLQRLARPLALARRIKVRGRNRSLTFDEWVPRVLDEVRDTPSLRDNHMRPQIAFLEPGDRIFAFENGLDAVFRWIDGVTDKSPGAPPERLKASTAPKPAVSESARQMIETHYKDDLDLHHAVLKGRAAV